MYVCVYICHIHIYIHIYVTFVRIHAHTHMYPICKVWQLWLKNAFLEYIAQLNERQFKFRSNTSLVQYSKENQKLCFLKQNINFLNPQVRYTILDKFQQLNTDT